MELKDKTDLELVELRLEINALRIQNMLEVLAKIVLFPDEFQNKDDGLVDAWDKATRESVRREKENALDNQS